MTEERVRALLPVLVGERKTHLLVQAEMEFRHPALKIYDIKPEVAVECVSRGGQALYRGLVREDIYYVGFVDGVLYYQALEIPFQGLCQMPEVTGDTDLRAVAELPAEQIVSRIVDNTRLEQTLLVDISITASRCEIIALPPAAAEPPTEPAASKPPHPAPWPVNYPREADREPGNPQEEGWGRGPAPAPGPSPPRPEGGRRA